MTLVVALRQGHDVEEGQVSAFPDKSAVRFIPKLLGNARPMMFAEPLTATDGLPEHP
jgi:hypothetical protein